MTLDFVTVSAASHGILLIKLYRPTQLKLMLNELRISSWTVFIKSMSIAKHHWVLKGETLHLVLLDIFSSFFSKYITSCWLERDEGYTCRAKKKESLEKQTGSARDLKHQLGMSSTRSKPESSWRKVIILLLPWSTALLILKQPCSIPPFQETTFFFNADINAAMCPSSLSGDCFILMIGDKLETIQKEAIIGVGGTKPPES